MMKTSIIKEYLKEFPKNYLTFDIKYTKKETDYLDNFLVPIKNIDAITFEKTINMFQDLNDLLFIFYEKSDEELKRSSNNVTKKVYLNQKSKHKNGTRKQYI